MRPQKIVKIARKWQQIASSRRAGISFPRTNLKLKDPPYVTDEGHFVVYTTDQRRFVVPLWFLSSDLFQEMFKLSEDEFGLSSNSPITVPCDAASMEYMILLIERGLAKDLEKALLSTLITSTASLDRKYAEEQVLVCG
ncbi:auxin-responsive protein SAUR68-like [Punica granatum]|uniref:Auxin-responsive protein SAUR68-like n=1 Tax=Punica granatum TaxID=22663 RepID=A0A6P8C3G1_PUNGR|nr:auxin-responsive protein SAUR68-like [Punica granatum]